MTPTASDCGTPPAERWQWRTPSCMPRLLIWHGGTTTIPIRNRYFILGVQKGRKKAEAGGGKGAEGRGPGTDWRALPHHEAMHEVSRRVEAVRRVCGTGRLPERICHLLARRRVAAGWLSPLIGDRRATEHVGDTASNIAQWRASARSRR